MADLSVNLPEGFLLGEERCGFYVTPERKQLWAVLLDLYLRFSKVCDCRGIQYFASSGTALGAVRHEGFIPWDDDLDVMMLREDFERFCRIGKEFQYPYFLQTFETDANYMAGHAQLRRSDTTGVLDAHLDYRRPFNQGIFIDIFPLDAIPDDNREAMRQARRVSRLRRLCFSAVEPRSREMLVKRSAKDWAYRVASLMMLKLHAREDLHAMMVAEQTRFNGFETQRLSNLTVTPKDSRSRRYVADLNDVIKMRFEFLEVPVPAGYDRALSGLYGDYHKPVRGGSSHGDLHVDFERSYVDWLDQYFDTSMPSA